MFKNPHLRLLMKLVGFERLAPSLDETPDSIWVVPSHITADELEESLEFISRAEFEPPAFENNQSAEDQLRRKPATRKKAEFDDDNDNDGFGGDDVLFPAGGPTARKVVAEPRRKTVRRRRQKALASDDDEDGLPEGPTEEELDEKARQRRQKELEKARRVKSDMYVHASDDETDDEKDRAFFEREEATRKRIQDLAALVSTQPRPSVLASDKPQPRPAKHKSKAKRKSTVLSDGSGDDDDDESTRGSSSQESAAPTSRRRRKRRKPSEEPAGSSDSDGDGDAENEDDIDVEDEDEDEDEDAAPILATKKRRHVGFVDSSDEEETSAPEGDAKGDAMDLDDAPPSTSVLSEIQLNGSSNAPNKAAAAVDDDDDDDDDDLPVQKRPRAKAGFVMDSDDE